MWGKILIPMYRLWLHGLYGLYRPRCPLSPKRPINLISLFLLLIASVADLTQSSKPILIATVEKYSLNTSTTRIWSFMISSLSEKAMWFPFLNFLLETNGEIVFQKLLSSFEHPSLKYLCMEFLRISTIKLLTRLFSSQEDFLYFLNLFLDMFLRYWAFLRAEFIYGTDCDETVLLLTGVW